ncbi:MAG: CoA transferase [Acidobacteria bacterium]|nr:CoA transferase [Acidobacteriota bacterium]
MSQAALLDDIVVIDVTQVMAGPYCTMVLADMGARVIKVEPPAGDSTRRMAGAEGDDSPAFAAVNRGKRGIVLDLAQDGGRDVLARLARNADVLVENFRPGVMARLGLDYTTLAADNPRLIYASISGFGQTGPFAQRGGFDLVAQGMSGIMSVTGEPDGPPTKCGLPITDLGAGLFALSGILAALHWRSRSGFGQHIDTSLFEAGLALSVWESAEYFSTGQTPQRLGSAHRMVAPYQAFRCADGYINIGAANDRAFARLAATLGHEDWLTDTRFATATTRVQHREALVSVIEAITMTATRDAWMARFDAAGIPCGPILDYAEAFAHPQTTARAMQVTTEHPLTGARTSVGSPLKLSSTPLNDTRRAPMLGEHTDEVLSSFGYSDDEIERLRAAGVAR